MKSSGFFYCFLLIVTIISCGKKEDPSLKSSMTATVNGATWNAINPHAVWVDGSLIISGADADSLHVKVTVAHSPAVATFDVDGDEGSMPVAAIVELLRDTVTLSNLNFYDSSKWGTVTITELDQVAGTVSGTFSASVKTIGSSPESLANGSFTKIPYTKPGQLTGAAGYLHANVNGVPITDIVTVGGYHTDNDELELIFVSADETREFLFYVPYTSSPTTYTFTADDTNTTQISYAEFGQSWLSQSGTLVVTATDPIAKTMTGTFSFTGFYLGNRALTNTVTEGSFLVQYQ